MGISLSFICACGDDDEEPIQDNNNLQSVLKENKWINKYVSEWYDTSYGGFYEEITDIYYFMDDNVGYNDYLCKTNDSSLGVDWNRGFTKFTYSISDNQITIRWEGNVTGNRTKTLTYMSGYLFEGDDDVYKPTTLNQSDRDYVSKKVQEMFADEMKQDISSTVYNYVEVTGKLNEVDLEIEFTINTQMTDKYQGQMFKYGIEYGYGDYANKSYLDMVGTNLKTFYLSILFGETYLCMSSYNALHDKMNKGEILTQSEKDLLRSVVPIIEENLKKIQVRIFVEHNSKKYYVYTDVFSVSLNLSTNTSI